jgi:hypothetical protein
MAAQNIISKKADIIVDSIQFQGSSNDCGAYTTATVINALSSLKSNSNQLNKSQDNMLVKLEGNKLAKEMERPVWRGILLVVRKIPNWATFPWGMVDVFRNYGLKARWGFGSNPPYLKQALVGNNVLMPIIGSWKPMWAHVMTLVAWDIENGWGFANTQYKEKEIRWLPDETFQRQWKAMGHLLVEVISD